MDRKRYMKNIAERAALVPVDNIRAIGKEQTAFLRQENAQMRLRLAKYNEIQLKIEKLLMRDDQISQQLEILKINFHQKVTQNQNLRNALQLERLSKIQIENNLRLQIQALSNQTIWVAKQRDQMRFTYEKLIEEIKYKASQQIQHIKLEFINIQKEYQLKSERLGDMVKVKTVELNHKERQFNNNKIHILEQVQSISNRLQNNCQENNYLKLEIQQYKTRQIQLINQHKRLSTLYQTAISQREKSQREKASIIYALEEQIKNISYQVNEAQAKIKIYQRDYFELETRYKDGLDLCDKIQKKSNNLEQELLKKISIIQKMNLQLNVVKDNHSKEYQISNVKFLTLEQDLVRSRNQSTTHLLRISQLQAQINAKTLEIKQLLYGIQRLEQKVLDFESKVRTSSQSSYSLQEKLQFCIQENQMLKFQVQSFRQKLNLKQMHLKDLENILQKQQLTKQSKQKQLLQMKKQSANPQQIVKKYEDQMFRMINLFEKEKGLMQEKWNQEKARLRQVYQYELKDKQDLFKKKIKVLQDQIQNKI